MAWFKSTRPDGTADLALAIVSSAFTCTDSVMSELEFATDKERHLMWYRIYCEFLYGFLQITDRLAFNDNRERAE